MKFFRATYRLIAIIGLTFYYTSRVVIKTMRGMPALQAGYEEAPKWGTALIRKLGIEIEIQGEKPAGKAIILSNHRSYTDIFLIYNFVNCAFVAKAELRGWPLMGYAAYVGGTIFVNRSDPNSRKSTILAIKEKLTQGYSVTVFPEGTTFVGPTTKEFKNGTFRIAAEGSIPVVPTAIEYEYVTDAWVGKEMFLPHFYRIYGRKVSKVKIRFGQPITNNDYQVLVNDTKTWINTNLTEMRAEFEKIRMN